MIAKYQLVLPIRVRVTDRISARRLLASISEPSTLIEIRFGTGAIINQERASLVYDFTSRVLFFRYDDGMPS